MKIKYLTVKRLIIVIVTSLIVTGCSISNTQILKKSPKEIYTIAQFKLRHNNWNQAIVQLKTLNNLYPCNPYSQQAQLDLIYAYYKNKDLLAAKIAIDHFTHLNPTHPNIDYVIYMRGLVNMEFENNTLHNFFIIDRSDRDPQHAREAFNDFSKLLYNYPNSHYSNDAIRRLFFLKNRLAKYEYSVAKYYLESGAWVAVVNRVEGMLRDYPDARATLDGLKLMEYAYRKMKITTQADKVERIISANTIHHP